MAHPGRRNRSKASPPRSHAFAVDLFTRASSEIPAAGSGVSPAVEFALQREL